MAAATRFARASAGAARLTARMFSAEAAGTPEQKMTALLKEKLKAEKVEVKDVSGGCGQFYNITVVSPVFQGMTMIKQHKAVNEVLEKEIGKMHGLTLKTSAR